MNSRYPNVRTRWTYESGHTISSTPAIWKELAIVGDASGKVYALSLKSGKVQWTFATSNAVYSTPDVSSDLVVLASTDGNVYALKAANGKEFWRYKSGRPIVASPRIADGMVYIGSSEGNFRALDLASGKPVWHFDGVGGFVETKPLVYDGKVIFGAWDEHLYALDARTGKLAWKWKGDKRGTLLSPAACWPVAANGKVFIVAPDRKMTAIDARTGEQLWRTGAYAVRESIGLSQDQARFYVRAMNDFFYAFSTAASHPDKVWELNAGFGYDINSAMLVEKDGVVFYGTKNDLLVALDAKNGRSQVGAQTRHRGHEHRRAAQFNAGPRHRFRRQGRASRGQALRPGHGWTLDPVRRTCAVRAYPFPHRAGFGEVRGGRIVSRPATSQDPAA